MQQTTLLPLFNEGATLVHPLGGASATFRSQNATRRQSKMAARDKTKGDKWKAVRVVARELLFQKAKLSG